MENKPLVWFDDPQGHQFILAGALPLISQLAQQPIHQKADCFLETAEEMKEKEKGQDTKDHKFDVLDVAPDAEQLTIFI